MRLAAPAEHLGTLHEEAAVGLGSDWGGIDRLREARPARAGIEFRVRREEILAAADTGIDAGRLRVPIGAGEGAFRPLLARDVILLGRELRAPFRVALLDFIA